MEAIAVCTEGIEEIAKNEIKEIIKQNSEIIIPSRIKFKIKDKIQLADYISKSRSTIKSYYLISSFKFENIENIFSKIKEIKFEKIKGPFAVKCERTGKHDFSSIDIEKEAGKIINKEGKLEVNLKDPTTIIIIDIVENNCFVGIDFTGIKLSRRGYRIKIIANSLNPCIAYAMIRFSDIKEKEAILDPFCRSGEIIIEAVMYLNKIPPNIRDVEKMAFTKLIKFNTKKIKGKNKKLNLYAIDSMQNSLRSAEINAKIAGINKNIKFSRYDIDWLDTKFKKESIDKIITFPQYPTNNLPKEKIEKIYKEFFYQSQFILKKTGKITLLTPCHELITKHAEENKFKISKKIEINYMNQNFKIMVFQKDI